MKKFLASAVIALSLSGCNWGQLKEAATEANPATGKTPPQQAVGAVPNILDNPMNPNSWADLIEALVVMGAAGFGVKEWRKYRRNQSNGNGNGA